MALKRRLPQRIFKSHQKKKKPFIVAGIILTLIFSFIGGTWFFYKTKPFIRKFRPQAASELFMRKNFSEFNLEEKIGQLLILGFQGLKPEDKSILKLAHQIRTNQVGGIISYGYNIEGPSQIKELNSFLKKQNTEIPVLITLDEEGGRVERLQPKKGFKGFPSAETVSHLSDKEVSQTYEGLAKELVTYGFNLNFAPCVDLNPPEGAGYKSPVIGDLQRSYSSDPSRVAHYAELMIEALKKFYVLNSIKHFPGHGSAQADSHEGFVEVTEEWRQEELEPFFKLIKIGKVDTIMTAHVFNATLDNKHPATLSKPTLQLLRKKGYEGVIVSDDLHMTAIQEKYGFREAVVSALKAGNDMVIFSNNPASARGIVGFKIDPDLPEKFIKVIKEAIENKELSEDRVNEAFSRVIALKEKLKK